MPITNKIGLNFRSTSGYVTDGTNETYDIGAVYPRSVSLDGNSYNVGWDSDMTANTRDRDSAGDRRLAGMVFKANGSGPIKWKFELPSTGQYTINLACGDNDNASNQYIEILDNTTLLDAYTGVAPNADEYMDAGGTIRTAAAWPGSSTPKTYTFATTTLYIKIGDPTSGSGGFSHLTHFDIIAVGGSSTTVTPAQAQLTLNGKIPFIGSNVRIREVLINESGQVVSSASGISVMVWYGGVPSGAPDVSLSAQTTDANGTTSWSIAIGTMSQGSAIFFAAFSGSPPSTYTCGRIVPNYE